MPESSHACAWLYRYASWFIKFKHFNNTPYPGGTPAARAANGSFHVRTNFIVWLRTNRGFPRSLLSIAICAQVPTCDWYGDAKSGPPKCSGFYHDQEQTPEHAPPGGGSYPAYRVDGQCIEQCDCGTVNPCAEYIFDVSSVWLGVHVSHPSMLTIAWPLCSTAVVKLMDRHSVTGAVLESQPSVQPY